AVWLRAVSARHVRPLCYTWLHRQSVKGARVSELEDLSRPSPGLYEQLITLRFEQRLKELSQLGWHPVSDIVGPESVPHVLARHVSSTVRRVLQALPAEDRVHAANH